MSEPPEPCTRRLDPRYRTYGTRTPLHAWRGWGFCLAMGVQNRSPRRLCDASNQIMSCTVAQSITWQFVAVFAPSR